MSLQRAILNLRSQRTEDQDNDTPLSINNELVDNPMESVSSFSFEDINFSDDDDDFPMDFITPSTSTVATPTTSTFATPTTLTVATPNTLTVTTPKLSSLTMPAIDKTRIERKRIPLVATPTSLSRLNLQSCSRHSNNINKTNKNSNQPRPPIPPINNTTSSSLLTPTINFQQRFPGQTARFPGPAGCLPQLVAGQTIDNNIISLPPTINPSPLTTPRRKRLTVSSPGNVPQANIEDDFSGPPWTTMMEQLNLSDPINNHLSKYTIAYAKRMAVNQLLVGGKIPHLRVLIKSICCTTKNISALVKDETGEMLATVHMKVWDEYKDDWTQGCCIILRQVTVLSPTPRKHYLNITSDNIVRLYPVIQNGRPFSNLSDLNSANNDFISLGIVKLCNNVTNQSVDKSRLYNTSCNGVTEDNNNNISEPSFTRTGTSYTGPSSLCTGPSSSCTGTSSLCTGPSSLCTGPSSSCTGSSSYSNFCSTNIDDEFDAFFNDIDVSSIDI